jgi:membrane protease YdiL (CAAX protease family)
MPSTRLYFTIALSLCVVGLLAPSLAALGVLHGRPEAYMAGAPLAVFSPTIAAVIAAKREGGWARVRELLGGLGAWRVSPVWYVVALALPAAVVVAGRAGVALVPGNAGGPWFFPPRRPEEISALFIVPIAEEIGWRGFALPRLIASHGAARATSILGALWAVWHVPMFLGTGWTGRQVLLGVVFIAIGNVTYTWFYRRAGASLLLAVLFHLGVHLDAPTLALPASATPLVAATAAYVVLAIAIFVLDRPSLEGTSPAYSKLGR